ncbi:RidA family protein [Dactylosporangium sp. NPDC051541]|uniref:RidA family protein n=1 Tax=Dactylosporangium sp. NPDC051541 TaxID=3363977 RepID=UPI00379985BE
MSIAQLDPAGLPAPTGNYTHGTLVTGAQRTVFVSGQVPWAGPEGPPPADFETLCRVVWANIAAVLAEAGLTLRHLAKITTYLADRRYREANSRIRAEVLGGHRPAVTIIICDIYSEDWLLEIEAVAMA